MKGHTTFMGLKKDQLDKDAKCPTNQATDLMSFQSKFRKFLLWKLTG